MKMVVTGSSGFIGTHIVMALVAAGHEVAGIDVTPPRDSNGSTLFQIDILDPHGLGRVFAQVQPEIVIHLAARTDLTGQTLADYAVNTEGVANVLDAVADTGSIRRVIFTSTQLVCRMGYVPTSDVDFAPNTLYGESKVVGEKLVRERDGGGVEWCITRPTTIWGPGMPFHYRRFLGMLRRGRYFHVGREPLRKSYGYVGNAAFEYRCLAEIRAESMHRKTFYIADYEPLELRAWANALQRALGGPPVRTIPRRVAHVAAAVGDAINFAGVGSFPFNSFRLKNVLTQYRFDTSSLQSACGDLPYTLDDGVRATAAWFLGLGTDGRIKPFKD